MSGMAECVVCSRQAGGLRRELGWSGVRGVGRRGEVGFGRRQKEGVTASSPASPQGQRRIELTYDPKAAFNELTRQVAADALTTRLTLFSPAKTNVFLRITNRQSDGNYELATLLHAVSLGDIIKFSISPSSRRDFLTTNTAGIPLNEHNLIIKALNLYRKKTGSKVFFWIHLDKQIPTEAGLGGYSGNAATALWAANDLSGFQVSEKELQKWSAEIGVDVPFFFSSGAAYCTGKGEVLQDVPPMPPDFPLVLLKPKEECLTAEVYKHFQFHQASSASPVQLLEEIMKNGISQSVCINDLELPAFEVFPSLKKFKERVIAVSRGRYQAVFMSGSGSTIVCVGDCEPPQFLYEEEKYNDVFISEANFITRKEGEWYKAPTS